MEIVVRNPMVFTTLAKESSYERCGVFVGDRTENKIEVVRLLEVPNTHSDRVNYFRINRNHVTRALKRTRLTPLGYWHTHIHEDQEDPSEHDMEQMGKYPHLVGMVYHVPTGTVTWFNNNTIVQREWVW